MSESIRACRAIDERMKGSAFAGVQDRETDGLCFLEPHATLKKANKISPVAVPKRVSVPRTFRTHFRIEYDTSEVAEVSWSFIREFPPKNSKKKL